MHDQFEIASFLQKAIASSQNGRVHIVGKNDVEWCLDIVDGRLLFAAHSFQYLTAFETILPSLGYEAALSVYWRLVRSEQYKYWSRDRGLAALGWTSRMVEGLIRYEALSPKQAENVLAKLSEDAVESLLGLETATVSWHSVPEDLWHSNAQGIVLSALIDRLLKRLKIWQSISDRIISPYQRPYCDNPDELHQSVPHGLLPSQMLTALSRLMQGASIRQLAHAVKQDETRLAKLLYPYIRHRVIKLWPPVQPLGRLPWIPHKESTMASDGGASLHEEEATTVVASPLPSGLGTPRSLPVTNGLVTDNKPLSSGPSGSKQSGSNKSYRRSSADTKSRYLIVCIDDSQAMLEKIDSYLDPNCFELKTVIDPVASVSKICAMKPDLVLMDVSMPSINGNSLCQILKRSYMFKDVPIIMISSNASPLNKATAQSSGATDYLEKPFSKAQLMKVLETYLEIQHSF
ncbi:MAG: response regulator [Leptolyngbya sp. SIO3F4]|nr:response regulator [Leptolyngbya sp. SIO3F4]